ncbi:hypothetical protein VTH06DRAFT_1905, partial [Thermothelomyces fergusii]
MAAAHPPPEPAVSRAPSPTAAQPPHQRPPPPPPPPPRALPDREVDAASIEDAYVAFILYCNPASFSTFALFELIKQLETRELKTWAELALKLGVDPPDQEKGQSSQKIQ